MTLQIRLLSCPKFDSCLYSYYKGVVIVIGIIDLVRTQNFSQN